MKDGRITQTGNYDDILSPGTDFMKFVGADNEALTALAEPNASKLTEVREGEFQDSDTKCKPLQNGGHGRDDDEEVVEKLRKVRLYKKKKEKEAKSFWVYWRFATTVYGGALVPVILLA